MNNEDFVYDLGEEMEGKAKGKRENNKSFHKLKIKIFSLEIDL